MVGVERKVIQVEEPEPIFFGDGSVTANGIVLIRHPDDQNNVESRRRVLKEFRHNSFHPLKKTPSFGQIF